MIRFCSGVCVAGSLLLQGCGPKATARKEALANPFSDLSLERYLQEVQPLVEASVGRKFDAPPIVEIAQQGPFNEMMMAEQILIYEKVMPDTPEAIRNQMVEASNESISRGLLGKYGLLDKKTYLCAEGLILSLKYSQTDPAETEAWTKLILAHEITHAMEDQELDMLAMLDTIRDEDALQAASGTWEGLATLAEEDVARELGLMDQYDQLIGLQGWSRDGLEEVRAYRTWATYGQGRDFVAYHRDNGGIEKMWKVMHNPPPTTGMLFRPESWAAEIAPPEMDYASVLRGTEQLLSKGEWIIANSKLGEFALRGEAIRSGDEEEFDRILAHLKDAHALTLERPDRKGAIRLLVFEDDTWPEQYLDLLRSEETASAAEIAAAMDVTVEVTYQPLPDLEEQVGADAATLRTQRVPIGGGRHRETRGAWVARGDTLVVVEAAQFRPGLRLGRTVEGVFSNLDAARAQVGAPAP